VPRVKSSGRKTYYGKTRPDVNHYLKWGLTEAKLSEKDLKELKRILKAKSYWSVKEAMKLAKELFGVNYSDEQIRRILVVISTTFVRLMDDTRNTIKETFYRAHPKAWLRSLLA
jgi:transposase